MTDNDQPIPAAEAFNSLLVGVSLEMRRVRSLIEGFARDQSPVLITGESGTGKTLAARAIHALSDRCGAPFVVINCAAMPANLIAVELFGYEKGAFPGAVARRRGRIEQAHGGTLLLEGIGELPQDLQGQLLRLMQEGALSRLGGHESVRVDVRIMAVTSLPLRDAIAQGRFREDLYYRLNALTLHMPALRERGADVELLARVLLRRIAAALGRKVLSFDREAIAAIQAYSWPGNARELIATLRRALVFATGLTIEVHDLEFESGQKLPRHGRIARRVPVNRDAERTLVSGVLERNHHNVTRAAQELGVSRVTMYRMLHRNGLEPRGAAAGEGQAAISQ